MPAPLLPPFRRAPSSGQASGLYHYSLPLGQGSLSRKNAGTEAARWGTAEAPKAKKTVKKRPIRSTLPGGHCLHVSNRL